MIIVGENIIQVVICLVCLTKTVSGNEVEAKKWLKGYNTDAEKVIYENVEAAWNYNTNLTDYNLNISVSIQLSYLNDLMFVINFYILQQEKASKNAEFDKVKYKEANKFKWRNFTDPLLKREFSKIVDIGPASLPDDDFSKVLIKNLYLYLSDLLCALRENTFKSLYHLYSAPTRWRSLTMKARLRKRHITTVVITAACRNTIHSANFKLI